MYRFDAEDPGQSLYIPTTVGVIHKEIVYCIKKVWKQHQLILFMHSIHPCIHVNV